MGPTDIRLYGLDLLRQGTGLEQAAAELSRCTWSAAVSPDWGEAYCVPQAAIRRAIEDLIAPPSCREYDRWPKRAQRRKGCGHGSVTYYEKAHAEECWTGPKPCNSYACPSCGPYWRDRHLQETWPNMVRSPTVYAAVLDASDWDRVYSRLKRRRAAYFRARRDDDAMHVFADVDFGDERRPPAGYERVVAEALRDLDPLRERVACALRLPGLRGIQRRGEWLPPEVPSPIGHLHRGHWLPTGQADQVLESLGIKERRVPGKRRSERRQVLLKAKAALKQAADEAEAEARRERKWTTWSPDDEES